MPTTRHPINRPPHARITPEAIALFRRALAIEACDDQSFWEEDGGSRREYLDVVDQLYRALGLQAFDLSPLACEGAPPAWEINPKLWRKAAQLRRALIDAAALNG
ncbi:hypothetical protein [Bradyrhizobium sp. UNPA324]|uniref:hypothetical protein n=1 Tax=Bradyrhizobium sp. UNPA324 TaxID=1141174 RepID=UPI00115284F7|nr:hypothetical protein [Bradyrhizobium sp. UNPA324]TQF30903.1 hypothetical protein UNPA324_15765 [Bradyrhizobium sp. UNPA324]